MAAIRGYTDSHGSAKANLALSQRRSESVRKWLLAKIGSARKNVLVQGLGAKNPALPNAKPDGTDNPEGRERNRRVTVTIPQSPEKAG